MSAHTKKHPISDLPSLKHEKESIPWREAFQEGIKKYSEIGLILRGGRYRAGLTQKILAEKIGVKPHHISEMENGKRTIGKNIAQRLSKVLGFDYRLFL